MVQQSQNAQKCRVLYTELSGYSLWVPDLLQNSQKCRVLWCNCRRTHRRIGYCGATVKELTEVVCGVTTDGKYPRHRSVGTLQNLSVEKMFSFLFLAPHACTTRFEEVFFSLENEGKKGSLRSRASLKYQHPRER